MAGSVESKLVLLPCEGVRSRSLNVELDRTESSRRGTVVVTVNEAVDVLWARDTDDLAGDKLRCVSRTVDVLVVLLLVAGAAAAYFFTGSAFATAETAGRLGRDTDAD